MENMGINKSYVISEGETYQEALASGLEKIGLTEAAVSIEILEEKKGSFFKKGVFKLKLVPLVEASSDADADSDLDLYDEAEDVDTTIEKVEKLVDQLNNQEAAKALPYVIEFREDGVYLTVSNLAHVNVKQTIDEILQLLNKKSVKNIEVPQITTAFNQENNPTLIAPPQEEVCIDSSIYLEISKDKLEAKILLTAPEGGKFFTFDELKNELFNKKIVYGLKEEVLRKIAINNLVETWFIVAEGKAAINGINGKIAYNFEINRELKPKSLEDGSVDYKQLNLINNVKEGELLAQIFRPTGGTPGMDVYGNVLSAKRGKEVNIRPGKNVEVDSEGLKFSSLKDGQVYISENKLNVSEIFEVPGDVDTSTGNINFNGTVAVRGNVQSGFTIEATGDIHINGVVEAATLKAKGNILLSRGIQGNNQAYIEAGGNIVAKYIENAKIKCLGSLHADCILHSDVVARGKIVLAGKKALVVGGDTRVGEELRARIIGSHMGTSTRIEVGIDPDDKAKYDELKNEIVEIERNSENLKKTIDLLGRMSKTGQIPRSKEEILVKSLKTYQFLKEKHQNLTNEFQQMQIKIQSLSNGKVHASGTIYPGVKVVILNSTRFVNDELSYCTLYKKDGDVVLGPYEK